MHRPNLETTHYVIVYLSVKLQKLEIGFKRAQIHAFELFVKFGFFYHRVQLLNFINNMIGRCMAISLVTNSRWIICYFEMKSQSLGHDIAAFKTRA